MSKYRFKVKKYSAGPNMREIFGKNYSITPSTSALVLENTDLYIADQSYSLATQNLLTNDAMYNSNYFDRKYLVNHPLFYNGGTDLQVKANSAEIIDTVQIGDSSFHLTKGSEEGIKYSTQCLNYLPSKDWYQELHEVCTYIPGTSANLNSHTIDLVVSKLAYKYTESTTTSGIPFSYLLEQPLDETSFFIDTTKNIVYGILNNLSGSYTVDKLYTSPEYSPASAVVFSSVSDDENPNNIYVNLFKLKNMYDTNWQVGVDRSIQSLSGVRDYLHTGITNGTIWLSYLYKTVRDEPIEKFEHVERIYGLYKYVPFNGHKANIFTIRINNSGLNLRLLDSTTRLSIQKTIEKVIYNAAKKMVPAHTALYKIEWVGI